MQTKIAEYENIVLELPQSIKNSKFKTEVFIKELGQTKATFYRKLSENRFAISEVKKIARILDLEKEIDSKLQASELDINEGRITKREEALR
jgi:hypothetical protein